MILERYGLLWLWVSGDAPFPDHEWKVVVDRIVGETPTVQPIRVLVGAGSVPPTAQQRWYLGNAIAGRDTTIAVVTESALVRGAVTALSWFSSLEIRGFSYSSFDQALAFLGAPGDEQRMCQRRIELLRAQLEHSGRSDEP